MRLVEAESIIQVTTSSVLSNSTCGINDLYFIFGFTWRNNHKQASYLLL